MTAEKQEMIENEPKVEEIVVSVDTETMFCPRCSQTKPVNRVDPHMCADCASAENTRLTYNRQHQDWLTVAAECGVDPWLQQPGETQWEYTVWVAYRDSYPGKRPTYSAVAQKLDTTYAVVRKISQRWTFPVRMQLWMKHVDDITMLQRRDEILTMNKENIELAQKLRKKINAAVDSINPDEVKPGEIVQMAKLAADLEREARIDTIAQDEMRSQLLVDNDNPDLKKAPTKQEDLSEVVSILMKAGALGTVTKVGVKQTTEVVMVDESDNTLTREVSHEGLE